MEREQGKRRRPAAEKAAPPRGTPMTSTLRVLRVCEALATQQPIGTRELARFLDFPRSTVQRSLETLEAAGWAVRSDVGRWCLSSRPVLVSARAGLAGALCELARPSLVRLQAATDESVRLWIREGAFVAIGSSLDSAQPVRHVSPPPGTLLPLHASASGKAILAKLPPEEVDALLARKLEALTPETITRADVLRKELAKIRKRGFASTHNEASQDVGGVAACIVDSAGIPIAALSISLPMHRLTTELVARFGAEVAAEAERLTEVFRGAGAPTARPEPRSRPSSR